MILFLVLVMGFGVQLQRTLSNLKRGYEKASETELSDGSRYEWFTPELTEFFKASVTHAIVQLAHEQNRALNEKLSTFDDVLIQDSSIVRLHESLSKKWTAARTMRVAAGVKVCLLVSAVADGTSAEFVIEDMNRETAEVFSRLQLGGYIPV